MHEHAVEADMVDVFAVDFEVVDGLSAGKLLDSVDRGCATILQTLRRSVVVSDSAETNAWRSWLQNG